MKNPLASFLSQILILALFPHVLFAQQGAILFDRSVRFEFEVPERLSNDQEMMSLMAAQAFSSLLLLFDEEASLMTPAPPPDEEESTDPRSARARGMVTRLKMNSPARSDQEVLLEAYVRYGDGALAETREFMTRRFLISGTRPAYQWRLTGEQSEFLGYPVHKATAVHDSSTIEAWFTPQIPVPAGPGLFGGLPGMILSVSVDDGKTVYSATEVNLVSVEAGVIEPPDDGEAVSREAYEEIVAEKLEEIRTTTQTRRRRGGGEMRE